MSIGTTRTCNPSPRPPAPALLYTFLCPPTCSASQTRSWLAVSSFSGSLFSFRAQLLFVFLAGRRAFSQSASRWSYESTIKNLRLHKDSKVLCQGFTGKTVSYNPKTPATEILYSSVPSVPFVAGKTGYVPHQGGIGVRNEYGWWCLSQEGRNDPPWFTCVRNGEGGELQLSLVVTFGFVGIDNMPLRACVVFSRVGSRKDTARRDCNLRPAAICC